MHRIPRFARRGMVVLLAILMLAILATATLALSWAARATGDRSAATTHALRQAREALLSYAADRALDGGVGPGYLPCPDRDGDGWAEATCGSLAGDSGQAQRLGLLPWKTLGLPDLRDADGQRLWYAVSTRHKGLLNCAASVACVDMSPATALGTITVRDARGAWMHDGRIADPLRALEGGAAAVVLAPGSPLPRADGRGPQGRDCVPGACAARKYLDVLPGLEDNAAFIDRSDSRGGNGDGFIAGPASTQEGTLAVNDRLVAIGYADLMPRVMARVAIEAGHCLELARQASGAWPEPQPACGSMPATIGRVPDISMATCNLASGPHAWWTSWKPYVWYARPAACAHGGDCVHVVDAGGTVASTSHAVAIAVGPRANECTPPRFTCTATGCDVPVSEGLDVVLALP